MTFALVGASGAGMRSLHAKAVRVAIVHLGAVGDDVRRRSRSRRRRTGWWGAVGAVGTMVAGRRRRQTTTTFDVLLVEEGMKVGKRLIHFFLHAPHLDRILEDSSLLKDVQSERHDGGVGDGSRRDLLDGESLGPQHLNGVVGIVRLFETLAIGFEVVGRQRPIGGEDVRHDRLGSHVGKAKHDIGEDIDVDGIKRGKELCLDGIFDLIVREERFDGEFVDALAFFDLGRSHAPNDGSGLTRMGGRIEGLPRTKSVGGIVHDEGEMTVQTASTGGVDGASIRIDLAFEGLQRRNGGLTDDDSKLGKREDKGRHLVRAHGGGCWMVMLVFVVLAF